MKTSTLLGIVAFLIIAGGILWAGLTYPLSVQTVGSPAGTTLNTEKQAAQVISLATPGAGATSTSLVNTDASSRHITSTKVLCSGVGTSQTAYTGAGLASLQVTVATTTTANPATIPVGFADVTQNQAVGTTTSELMFASSTLLTATSSLASIWHAGENLTFWFNATNTAICTIGVNYTQG